MSPAPRYLLVFGQRIVIGRQATPIDISDTHGHGMVAYGLYHPEGPSILLSSAAGPERQRGTLLHETLHAMMDVTGLAETLGDNEEEVVNRLGPALLDFIRANKRTITYLQETE